MNEAEWRKLPVGAWFFTDDPSCIQRYSVMERTSGGCVNVCSSCWHHDGAKKDMKSIADDHYAAAQLAEKERKIARLTEDNEHLKDLLRCDPSDEIEDGFGGAWSRTCPECGLGTMHVNRPGAVQCDYCE